MDREYLERLYSELNHRGFVHPDPIEFLYEYQEGPDREIVALVASSLAYGRVEQILASVNRALEAMGPSPSAFAADSSPASLARAFSGFKHRFTTGAEMARMLAAVREVLAEHGSLEALFALGVSEGDETVVPALCSFVKRLRLPGEDGTCSLLPVPERGSACKRLNLFLRWMVRSDEVDPGGWDSVSPSMLVVPLDTHMHRFARLAGFTSRKAADLRTAIEVTRAFARFSPDDPVKYDFSVTRMGIRPELSFEALEAAVAAGKGRIAC